MRNLVLPFFFALISIFAPLSSYGEDVSFISVDSPSSVKQYGTFEITASISKTPSNPYNYNEVDIFSEITDPAGKVVNIHAFYAGRENIWKVRYTPVAAGRFRYSLNLRSGSKNVISRSGQFEVKPDSADGFLRRSSKSPLYPVFDSGKTFIGLGHNLAWITNNNASSYEAFFSLMEESGCNLTRIWINNRWTLNIEDRSIGTYNSKDSDKLDAILELAKRYGIYIILTLDSYSSLMDEKGGWSEESWKYNPYNKENGGPCEHPMEFFTDKKAKEYYKNRIKYIIARWGHSPNIMAFELWNEFDAPLDWVKEMASYIKSINPHGQFVTTSLGYPWGNNFQEASVWSLDEIDIIDRHLYGEMSPDIIENIISVNGVMADKFEKPMLIGEFGLNSSKSDSEIDRAGSGAGLHMSLWSSLMTRSFSGAMNWWWAEYVRPKNLYSNYHALRNFLKDVDFKGWDIMPLKTTLLRRSVKGKIVSSAVTVKTNDSWGETTYKDFIIKNNGDISGGMINAYLHGMAKRDLRIDPVIEVDYPKDGKFILRIDMVSQGANLSVSLDGKTVLTKELPAGPGEGPWKRSLYRKDEKIYQCIYDTPVEIDVPKGQHTIQISNNGKDWARIKNITLTNYTDSSFVYARAAGLNTGDQMLVWLQNKEYNWKNDKKGMAPSPVSGAYFSVLDMPDGEYDIEWWDTFKGERLSSAAVKSENKELLLTVPEFTKDIACKIRKRGSYEKIR